MRVFITGATGFVGRRLVARLRHDGHEVLAWVRSEHRARSTLGTGVGLFPTTAADGAVQEALSGCDAVANLAGEPVLPRRWTAGRKRTLASSRVELTQRLVDVLGRTASRPRVLVSASATGYYGDRGDEILSESSSPGSGFLADLCRNWEAAALRAEAMGLRVVLLRIGIVLGSDGGALARMLPPFRAGLGGPIGAGRQFMSWIHADDLVAIATAALTDERYRGAVNATAPAPLTSREFARALAGAVHRPALLPAPGFALRVALGEAGSVLLHSQRVLPRRLQELGFAHRYPNIGAALADLVG